MSLLKRQLSTGTDWARVKREAAADMPVDDLAGPYNPNDTAAVAAYWQQTTITRGSGRPAIAVRRHNLNMRVNAGVLNAFKATGPGLADPDQRRAA